MARSVPGLELILDEHPLLAGERAVVRPHEVLATGRGDAFLDRELVEPGREAFGRPAGVAEHDRRAVLEDQLEQAWMHRRPDAASEGTRRRGAAHRLLDHLTERAHVLDGNDDLDVERLADARVDDRHRPGPAVDAAAEEAGDLVERTLGRRETDPLEWLVGDLLEPLERQREVRAALRRGEGVDLVDDDRVDAAQRVARR